MLYLKNLKKNQVNNKPFTNRLRSEIMKRFVNDKGQTLEDLLKLVPKNSNFKESWKKADDSFKNDKNKKKKNFYQEISKKPKNVKILKKENKYKIRIKIKSKFCAHS
ncbi:hypothetical protein BpHYR1_022678 [Brachionus plicatilis]|uniref:Uncharacterized protein n=1 Tax=Brachionus plicatilis TaxID=10195 RepID=A0A3M7SJY6_BRAPC|nr:hypothetical protein BpHYR1_022678 [Brachionus plicatilis]